MKSIICSQSVCNHDKFISLVAQGLAVFFFLAPGYENIGIAFVLVSMFFAAMNRRGEVTKVRFGYTASYVLLALFWFHLMGYAESKIYIFAGVFFAGYAVSKNAHHPQLTFILVFFLPWVAHLLFGVGQIAIHMLNFSPNNLQHLLVTSKSSLSIGVKYYSTVLSYIIISSWVFWCAVKSVVWKYLFFGALFMLAIMDNRIALLSVTLSIITYHLTFRKSIEMARVVNHVFKLIIVVIIALTIYVSYPRLTLGYQSLLAVLNSDYQSWIYSNLFLDEFCNGDGAKCTVDQSIYFRISWLIFGLKVAFENPTGIGLGAGPLDRALEFYRIPGIEYTGRDFHSELINIAVMFGMVGVLILFTSVGLIFFALKKINSGNHQNWSMLAYMLLTISSMRFVIESVGGDGMYLFLLLLLAYIVTEVTETLRPT